MRLESCGLDVQVKSMSYPEALAHLEEEALASNDLVELHKFRMETLVRIYGQEVADKLKADNGELVALYRATLNKTWGREGDGKNS